MERVLEWLGGHGKPLRVKVTTMDADLNSISVDRDASGQQLFDTVCKIIGIREVWYFGLCFTNRRGYSCWLQLDKKVPREGRPSFPGKNKLNVWPDQAPGGAKTGGWLSALSLPRQILPRVCQSGTDPGPDQAPLLPPDPPIDPLHGPLLPL